jgi:hypothetical protein
MPRSPMWFLPLRFTDLKFYIYYSYLSCMLHVLPMFTHTRARAHTHTHQVKVRITKHLEVYELQSTSVHNFSVLHFLNVICSPQYFILRQSQSMFFPPSERSEVKQQVKSHNSLFWNVMSCSRLEVQLHFKGIRWTSAGLCGINSRRQCVSTRCWWTSFGLHSVMYQMIVVLFMSTTVATLNPTSKITVCKYIFLRKWEIKVTKWFGAKICEI